MEPTLDTLDSQLPGVQALRTFSGHIQELSELENSLSEPYEVQEQNISTFCESVMDKIRSKVQEDVVLTVNAPKLNVKSIQSIWNASCYICWRIPPNTLRQAERYGWISKNAVPIHISSSSVTQVAEFPKNNARVYSSRSPK